MIRCELVLQLDCCSESPIFNNVGMVTSSHRAPLHTPPSLLSLPSVLDATPPPGLSGLLQDPSGLEPVSEDLKLLLFTGVWPRDPSQPKLPDWVKEELASSLDPPNLLGLDWRQLATELGLDVCVPYLTTVGRPTDHLLTAAEVLCPTVKDIQAALERIGREDSAAILRAFLARQQRAAAATSAN